MDEQTSPSLLAPHPSFGSVSIRERGRLPHWERDGGCYFVTFRLADSLPKHVCAQIAASRRRIAAAVRSGRELLNCEKAMQLKFTAKQFEDYLDAGNGCCALRDEKIAEGLSGALKLADGERYKLLAWCIMPNHVHVVFRLLPGHKMSDVVSVWKSYTAHLANETLGRHGKFWQREYYDRLIRNGDELDRAVRYVANNPEKAGLKDWKWLYVLNGL